MEKRRISSFRATRSRSGDSWHVSFGPQVCALPSIHSTTVTLPYIMWKAAELAETLKTRTGIKVCLGGLMVLMGVSVVSVLSGGGDVLNGFSSRQKLAKWQLELTIGGFCMSSLPEKVCL